MAYLAVALGGAAGSLLRYIISTMNIFAFTAFPLATLFINVSGSFLIGFGASLSSSSGQELLQGNWRTFFMVGVCGGFTTFSSFSLQNLTLIEDGRPLMAILNIVSSVILCLLSVWAGLLAARYFNAHILPYLFTTK